MYRYRYGIRVHTGNAGITQFTLSIPIHIIYIFDVRGRIRRRAIYDSKYNMLIVSGTRGPYYTERFHKYCRAHGAKHDTRVNTRDAAIGCCVQ